MFKHKLRPICSAFIKRLIHAKQRMKILIEALSLHIFSKGVYRCEECRLKFENEMENVSSLSLSLLPSLSHTSSFHLTKLKSPVMLYTKLKNIFISLSPLRQIGLAITASPPRNKVLKNHLFTNIKKNHISDIDSTKFVRPFWWWSWLIPPMLGLHEQLR